MKQVLLLLFFIATSYCNAQDLLAKKGTITLATNEKISFERLELVDGHFKYFEPTTGEDKKIAISTVKVIDDENHKRVFTNRNIIISTEFSQGMVIEKTKADTIASAKKPAPKKEDAKVAANGCPNGIYYTKEDFINKVPNSTAVVIPKGLVGFTKEEIVDDIPAECYFYLKNEDKKLKRVFAVCYKGHIYFQTQAILDNRNKTDRAQTNHFPNGFAKVISLGENYYYTEVSLANKWAQGFAYGSGGAVGGAIGSSLGNHKGIVWDVKNKEFNIFKNCNDYNDFIKVLYPEGVQECKNHQPDIVKVREAIEKIK
ncbi:hypothetical protein D3C87_67600 [compost metagenome]